MTHPSPPLKWLLAYRLLGLRLPAEYRPWVVQDTRSKAFLTWRGGRTFVWLVALIGLFAFGYRMGLDRWPTRIYLVRAVIVALAIALFSSREQLVRRTLRWHHLDRKGNPTTRVKRLARLHNPEAALLGMAVLVAFTAASTLFGYGSRPTGVAAAPCREAEPAVFDRITAGATGDPKYVTTRMIRYKPGDLVVAILAPKPGDKKGTLEMWLVTPERVERILLEKDQKTSTSFPTAESLDRVTGDAIERAFECLRPDARVIR